MRTLVIKQNETWSDLICPYCKKILDTFHSECLYDENECPHCKEKIERSIYQEEYDKECEEIEKKMKRLIKWLKENYNNENIRKL